MCVILTLPASTPRVLLSAGFVLSVCTRQQLSVQTNLLLQPLLTRMRGKNGGKVMMLSSTISALHGGVFTSLFQNRSLETVLSRAHPAHSSFEWLISLSGPLFRHSLFQNRSLETVLSRAYLAHPSCGWLLSLSGPFVSLLPVPDSIARDCTKVSVSSTPLMAFASGGDSALQSISMASPCTRIDRSRLYYGARSSRDQTLSQIQRLKLENPRAPAF